MDQSTRLHTALFTLAFLCLPLRAAEDTLPAARPLGSLEVVARFDGPMPTGVTVSSEKRIFVNFPRWGDDVAYTVAELRDGRTVAYPDEAINRWPVADPAGDTNPPDASKRFVSVQSVVVDPRDRLWVLDTGRVEWGPPVPGGPKLVEIDLTKNAVVRTILLPPPVALPTTYLNDVRFALAPDGSGLAFITDSSKDGANALIVVDLASGRSWRKLEDHPSVRPVPNFLPFVEGRPLMNRPAAGPPTHMTVGADGIALSSDGQTLWYRPLSGRGLFSVPTAVLADPGLAAEAVAAAVRHHGDLGFASDGLEMDRQGRLFLTNYEDNALVRRDPDGTLTTIVCDPRLLWPDTLALGPDDDLYVTANQLHRQKGLQGGEDRRAKPYVLFRLQVE